MLITLVIEFGIHAFLYKRKFSPYVVIVYDSLKIVNICLFEIRIEFRKVCIS